MLEKGILKCRVQAQWSEGLREKMKELIASYGGKLIMESEKESRTNGESAPKEHPSWLARKEKWLVGFDVASFKAFMEKHPEAVEPPGAKVLACVENFIEEATLETICVRDLYEALEKHFGPLLPYTC